MAGITVLCPHCEQVERYRYGDDIIGVQCNIIEGIKGTPKAYCKHCGELIENLGEHSLRKVCEENEEMER